MRDNYSISDMKYEMLKKAMGWASIALMLPLAFSCSDEKDNARLAVELTDAPAGYDKVWVDVEGVEVRVGDKTMDVSNDALDKGNLLVDLLTLTGGKTLLLADEDVPAGEISEIRLILGDKNSLVKDGVTYALKTPSAQQSGLKLKVKQELLPGVLYRLLLDFDASRSIVELGNGNYNLKPVVRASFEATSGAISGTVNTPAQVYALAGADTVAGTTSASDGVYALKAMPAGTYTLSFKPLDAAYAAKQLEGVKVEIGKVTAVPAVTLVQQPK